MERGVVIINGYPNGDKFFRQGERIAAALTARGIQTDVLKNGEAYATLTQEGRVQSSIAEKYSFAVYLDKDKYLGELLEKTGLKMFNNANAVEICDDKMKTYLALLGGNIPLIETVAAPLCYTPNASPNVVFLENVAKQLGFPLVAKKSYGSFGAGVRLIHGMPELIKTEQEWLHEAHFFQRFEASSFGRDIRMIIIGGKAVACMERVAQAGEFRSNVELGGIGRGITPDQAYIDVAERAAKVLGLDYCGVDVLETDRGPVICEVNSNAFFEGIEAVTGKDIADEYAKHIIKILDKC
ncbi:MAG: RimK family alpha-L-glutamate ligase [Clostridiales bacterium]|nr:RimK family alpha-L-glutamate ligase [Clostridiales bacterium]